MRTSGRRIHYLPVPGERILSYCTLYSVHVYTGYCKLNWYRYRYWRRQGADVIPLLPVDHPDVGLQELQHDVVPAPLALPVPLQGLAVGGAGRRIVKNLHMGQQFTVFQQRIS